VRVAQDVCMAHVAAGSIIERKGQMAQSWIGVLSGLIKISVGTRRWQAGFVDGRASRRMDRRRHAAEARSTQVRCSGLA
jgi:hypothetical protein